jgi:hypothetical protein
MLLWNLSCYPKIWYAIWFNFEIDLVSIGIVIVFIENRSNYVANITSSSSSDIP